MLCESATIQFAAFVHWEGGHFPKSAGRLPWAEVGLGEMSDLLGGRVADDARDRLFTTQAAGYAENHDFYNAGAFAEAGFDVGGIQLAACDIDEITHAACQDYALGGT